MNEVATTVLPHPITMFILGGMLLGLVLLYFEFQRTRRQLISFRNEVQKLQDQLEAIKEQTIRSVGEVSRKVDSRIDKALGTLKK